MLTAVMLYHRVEQTVQLYSLVLFQFLPVTEEKRKQSSGCLHHVVVLLPKQQAEPAAQVSCLLQLGTVPLQEAPQALETPLDTDSAFQPCHEITLMNEIRAHLLPPADNILYYSCSYSYSAGFPFLPKHFGRHGSCYVAF